MTEKAFEADLTVLAAVVLVPLFCLAIVPILLWNGWAAAILWSWFVVPVFNAPAISISQGAGIALVLGMLRFKLSAPKDEIKWSTRLVALVIGPPISVALGWIIKWTAL